MNILNLLDLCEFKWIVVVVVMVIEGVYGYRIFAAYGCTSGYYFYKKNQDSNITDATEKITFHSFPFKNQDLFDKWIRAISRDNFVPSKWSRLCSLHFHPTDFVENHTYSNLKRKRIHKAGKLAKRYLKEDAVPSIFQNAPKYLSRPNVAP